MNRLLAAECAKLRVKITILLANIPSHTFLVTFARGYIESCVESLSLHGICILTIIYPYMKRFLYVLQSMLFCDCFLQNLLFSRGLSFFPKIKSLNKTHC